MIFGNKIYKGNCACGSGKEFVFCCEELEKNFKKYLQGLLQIWWVFCLLKNLVIELEDKLKKLIPQKIVGLLS